MARACTSRSDIPVWPDAFVFPGAVQNFCTSAGGSLNCWPMLGIDLEPYWPSFALLWLGALSKTRLWTESLKFLLVWSVPTTGSSLPANRAQGKCFFLWHYSSYHDSCWEITRTKGREDFAFKLQVTSLAQKKRSYEVITQNRKSQKGIHSLFAECTVEMGSNQKKTCQRGNLFVSFHVLYNLFTVCKDNWELKKRSGLKTIPHLIM